MVTTFICTAEVAKHKGPPVYTEDERYKMVRGIKWVDEVRCHTIHFIYSLIQEIVFKGFHQT